MSRLLRIVPILLTLAAILAVTLPHVGARVATSAVINAPIVSVKAPLEGKIGTP